MKQATPNDDTQRFPMHYAFYDHANIQKFLEQKSEEGWMLKSFTNSTFIPAEPKKRHFSVVYYSDKSTKDRSPYERRQEFLEYCKHGGWNLITSTDEIMIFCSEEDSPIPIETDLQMELCNIHAVAKSHFLRMIPQFLLTALWMVGLYLDLAYDLTEFFASSHEWMYSLLLSVNLFFIIHESIIYHRWYHTAKEAAANGQLWEAPKRNQFSRTVTVVQGAYLIFCVVLDKDLQLIAFFAFGFMALIFLVRWILKKCKVSDGIMGIITLLIVFPLCMVFFVLCAFFLPGETARNELPLSICDLTDADPTDYTATLTEQGTFLVSQQTGKHYAAAEHDDRPEIRYTVTTVHAAFLYDACVNDLMKDQDYVPTDAAPWGAGDAYWDAQDLAYILFYDDRIVEIKFTWEPTTEQMAIVGQKLAQA